MQGGVGAFTREVGRAMVRSGHEVSVFTREQVGNTQPDSIMISPQVNGRWGWRTNSLIKRWAQQNKLEVLNIQFQTAAFDLHPSVHWLPSQETRIPSIVTFHDLRVPYLFPKAGRLRERIVRKLASTARGVIATDRADGAVLSEQWRIPHVCWIPIGSNVSTLLPDGYNRAAYRRDLGFHEDDLMISYFGFLNESKGALILIEALARLIQDHIPARLIMIGGRLGASDTTNIAYGDRVDNVISKHGLSEHIHWTGFVDDQAVSAAFFSSDVTALPYLDGVSLRRGTLMAALAHGRAIVTTTPSTIIPELEGAIETVRPGDSNALAAGLKMLWQDEQRRRQLEIAAKNVASIFTWDSIASKTIEFFEQVIS